MMPEQQSLPVKSLDRKLDEPRITKGGDPTH